MAIPGTKFVKMSLEELAKGSILKCTRCDNPIDEHPDDVLYRISGKVVCSDCYFEDMGEFVEKNPIYRPGCRRG